VIWTVVSKMNHQ